MDNLHKAIWEFFDDFHQPSAKGAVYPTPWIWPEEAHADAAIQDEWKDMAEKCRALGISICDGGAHRALRMLAAENGWKVNTLWKTCVHHPSDNIIYKISSEDDQRAFKVRKKEEAQTDSLDIDKIALARMMSDMLDEEIYHVEPLAYHGDDLVGFVCAMLAEENGWVKTEPTGKRWDIKWKDYKKVYRIR